MSAEANRPPQVEKDVSQTLVIPAFNEEHRIQNTIDIIFAYLADQAYSFEVIVVDDGSTDQTAPLAREAAERHPQLQVIQIHHRGKAAAVRAGMGASTGTLVAFADADLATPIHYLESFRDSALDGADVVIGSREDPGASRIGEPAYRHVMGRVFNGLVRGLLLPEIQDTQCGFKLFTRSAATVILQNAKLYKGANQVSGARVTAFDVEMLVIAARNGMRIESVPVTWTFGTQSKVNPVFDTLANLQDIASVKYYDLRGDYLVSGS